MARLRARLVSLLPGEPWSFWLLKDEYSRRRAFAPPCFWPIVNAAADAYEYAKVSSVAFMRSSEVGLDSRDRESARSTEPCLDVSRRRAPLRIAPASPPRSSP